jgi:hypothetical protein
MPILENHAHEIFAQARFAGKSLEEAQAEAGLRGDKSVASRLGRTAEVRERIAELYRERAARTAYEKTNAVRDLLAILHTAPADADEDNPLCEVRMGKEGTYHRLPPKLQAMARLMKLMGWDEPPPPQPEAERRDTLRDWLAAERSGRLKGIPREPDDPDAARREGPMDVEKVIAKMKAQIYANELAPTTANNGKPSPTTASALTPKQEAFAVARVKGLGVMAAYHEAGFAGDTPNLAWRLNQMPKVRARIAELNGAVEAETGYGKDDAVRDLLAIIQARPREAGPDHPLCERRMTSWGEYHRFPSKLAALTLLARLCGWTRTAKQVPAGTEPYDPDAGLRGFLTRTRAARS